jgi:hypothetical protein
MRTHPLTTLISVLQSQFGARPATVGRMSAYNTVRANVEI